jgi:hypothetical protein
MNSPARDHVTCFLCCQLCDCCYAIISAHVSTIEAEMFSVWSVRRLYNEFQMKPVSVRVFSSVEVLGQFSAILKAVQFEVVPDKKCYKIVK